MNKKINLSISGMHCASCAANIEHELKGHDGIKSINVNFASEKLTVEFDENKTDIGKIIKAVEKTGYQASEPSEHDDGHKHHAKITQAKNQFIIALILSLPIFYLSMGKMIGLPHIPLNASLETLIQFILATVTIAICLKIWIMGIRSLLRLRPDMYSLFFVGTAAAYFSSLVQAINFGLKPTDMMPAIYFESAVFILVFIIEVGSKESNLMRIEKVPQSFKTATEILVRSS